MDDNHGPGVNPVYSRSAGVCDLRPVHHAAPQWPRFAGYPLLRRSRVDGIIFVGLIAILIYNNIASHGELITTWLLSALALMGLYLFWIRRRKSSSNQLVFFRQYLDRI
jgi:hypothetical protein